MNALNIISGLGSSSPSTPIASRTASLANIQQALQDDPLDECGDGAVDGKSQTDGSDGDQDFIADEEKIPLAQEKDQQNNDQAPEAPRKSWRLIPNRFTDFVVNTVRILLTTIFFPITYAVTCFYDSDGHFSAMLPIRRLYRSSPRKRRRKQAVPSSQPTGPVASDEDHSATPRLRPRDSVRSGTPTSMKSETREDREETPVDSPAHNTRSKTALEESPMAKRSIRIKIQPDAAQKKRHSRAKSMDSSGTEDDRLQAVANALKSPSSPAVTKLKYPRAPAPPRPLVPRRQPSYSNIFSPDTPKKTLILDLDETLIHSMAKGGRMSTGHMVEVKFQTPIGAGGMVIGPQVPILYYVHERPHCHEFLRKVCKWFNLVIFTASVQEYADPVIDWLERERAYFAGRYYRQHCTYRNGAYIKDLSQVEPDLSKVMILDNSPMSYIFHEDNAIPIEGWISDPTDNDLLHLVPFLEGLQYVTDVRALLALRMGQTERA